MSQDNTNLVEETLSKLAETGVASKLDELDAIDINLQTNPIKAIQGEIESASLVATGMVIKKDLRVEKMELQTDSIAINPLSVAFGKVELTQATRASMRVILTEADMNRAFNSDYIRSKLPSLTIIKDNQSMTIDIQQ